MIETADLSRKFFWICGIVPLIQGKPMLYHGFESPLFIPAVVPQRLHTTCQQQCFFHTLDTVFDCAHGIIASLSLSRALASTNNFLGYSSPVSMTAVTLVVYTLSSARRSIRICSSSLTDLCTHRRRTSFETLTSPFLESSINYPLNWVYCSVYQGLLFFQY
jgi:hypothetical protein